MVELAAFSVRGKTSILTTLLDVASLTQLILDGGEEASNLIPCQFFGTLKNATGIYHITLKYCAVDLFDFSDFICWFFGDWRMRGIKKGDQVDGMGIDWHLEIKSLSSFGKGGVKLTVNNGFQSMCNGQDRPIIPISSWIVRHIRSSVE
ncbi:hypothetical protein BT69DRAFT_1294429 [Atractiella rhizophila]|nr:hypothetical protein BT69DRAFT_1294429 [Atractiella rhizophila]